jgi:WD40 repeat protein
MSTKSAAPVRLPDPSVAAAVSARRERSARLARESALKWQFWRWRPKVSLCTFQIAALCIGGIVLIAQRSVPWRPTIKLQGHAGKIAMASFSPDGQSIATAGEDGTARIWDANTGEQKLVLQHEKQKINDQEVPPAPFLTVMYSPDGQKVVTTEDGGPAEIWNAGSATVATTMAGPNLLFNSAVCSPDGTKVLLTNKTGHLATGDMDPYRGGTILNEYQPIEFLESASFTRDGKLIVTSTTNGVLQVWETTGRFRGAMRGDVNFFRSPVFSSDGRTIATAGNDCSVRLWKGTSDEDDKSILDSSLPAQTANEASAGQRSRAWFIRPLKVMRGHSRYVSCTQFSPDGNRLVTVALDGSTYVWDGHNGDLLAKLTESGPWRSAVFSPDGLRICAAGIDGTVQIWDRRCVERWYGVLTLPETWFVLLVLFPALIWSIRRDRRSFVELQAAS